MGHLASKISLARLPSLGRPVGNYWQRRAEGLSQGRETASQRTLAGNHRLPAHSLKRLSLPSTYFSTLFVFWETVKTHTHTQQKGRFHLPVPATIWGRGPRCDCAKNA